MFHRVIERKKKFWRAITAVATARVLTAAFQDSPKVHVCFVLKNKSIFLRNKSEVLEERECVEKGVPGEGSVYSLFKP